MTKTQEACVFKATPLGNFFTRPRLGTSLVASILALFLTSCSSMVDIPIGSSYEQVQQRYGRPTISCQDGALTIHIWSQQPMGYYAWRGLFDEHEQLINIQQVLSDPLFAQVERDIPTHPWDLDQVGCYFGPPAEQSVAPYIGVPMKVWTYRYKQNSVWPMMMNIFFDEQNRVHALQRSMDPQDDDGMMWFGF